MGDLCKEFVDIPLGSVIYHEKFAGSGRSRLDKSAEVSACKRHMPDTCAFVPTTCKTFPGKLLEFQKAHENETPRTMCDIKCQFFGVRLWAGF